MARQARFTLDLDAQAAHLVRLYFLHVEYLAHRTLHQLAKPFRQSMLARMASQQPRRPQFVRIPQFLRLAAGQLPLLGQHVGVTAVPFSKRGDLPSQDIGRAVSTPSAACSSARPDSCR